MDRDAALQLINRRYADVHGAVPGLDYAVFHVHRRAGAIGAALGYRRADSGRLFLEAYLDAPIEELLAVATGRTIVRRDIVEIGNLAADTAPAMVALWTLASNDLAGEAEIAVAVLTAPLRHMFRRLGVTLHILAPATPERLGTAARDWGRYYLNDPQVCAGAIADGQARLARFGMRRMGRAA